MSDSSYAFMGLADDVGYLVRVLVAVVVAGGVCWLACHVFGLAWARAATARRRHRAESAIRAEAARGLAEIDRFVRTHGTRITGSGFPDSDGTHDS